jgi:hypothetical protein
MRSSSAMTDIPSPYDLSYGRQMREKIAAQKEFDHKKASEHITRVLGFVANQHKEAIIHDIYTLLGKDRLRELDGYILALSRCMEHDLAWHCLSEAYQRVQKPTPDKYYKVFGKERKEDQSPPPSMSVE